MTVPANFPLRVPTGRRSLRFFASGTATADYGDTAYLFINGAGANPFSPTPYVAPGAETQVVNVGNQTTGSGVPMGTGRNVHDVNQDLPFAIQPPPVALTWSQAIRVCNDGGGNLYYSFDGTNDHGMLKANEEFVYRHRYEAGICFRGAGVAFRVEAW